MPTDEVFLLADLWSSNGSQNTSICNGSCKNYLTQKQHGERDVVAALRLVFSILSVAGSLSIIVSSLRRKTVCNPKVYPIFILSLADLLLESLWISGSAVWLKGDSHHHNNTVFCYTIILMTVILECVTVNLILIYALKAYSSLKQKISSGIYIAQHGYVSTYIWHPLLNFIFYFIAWTLPVVIIMVPFAVLNSSKYNLVKHTNRCSCGCTPYFGNILAYPKSRENDNYNKALSYFVISYTVAIMVHYVFGFILLLIIYWKIFCLIKRIKAPRQHHRTLYGATQMTIAKGHKLAQDRITLFLSVFLVTGIVDLLVASYCLKLQIEALNGHGITTATVFHRDFYSFLIIEAVFVPMQGILNAAVYGWTREEFLDIMTSHQIQSGQDTPEEEDQLLEDSRRMDRESFEQSMSLSLSRDQRVNEGRKVEVDVITPLSPWSS